jgi:hypothetical protein
LCDHICTETLCLPKYRCRERVLKKNEETAKRVVAKEQKKRTCVYYELLNLSLHRYFTKHTVSVQIRSRRYALVVDRELINTRIDPAHIRRIRSGTDSDGRKKRKKILTPNPSGWCFYGKIQVASRGKDASDARTTCRGFGRGSLECKISNMSRQYSILHLYLAPPCSGRFSFPENGRGCACNRSVRSVIFDPAVSHPTVRRFLLVVGGSRIALGNVRYRRRTFLGLFLHQQAP